MKTKPILNQFGNAQYVWVKKVVADKDAGFYKHSPGYYLVAKDDKKSIYAFKKVLDESNPPEDHLEFCDSKETDKLEKLYENQDR